MKFRPLTAIVMALVLTAVGCSSTSNDDPESVLRAYEAARNSGDVDAVIEFYAEDAVVKDSPVGEGGIANGKDEIRSIEAQIPEIQGSTGGIEFLDMTVSGNTVTFNHKFLTADGDCFGGTGDQVTIEDDKITLYDWGTDDPSQCEMEPSTTSSSAVESSASAAVVDNERSIDVEGHRGARGIRPENTLPSFEAALDAGVNTLEFDLHLSHDGQLVVWHDPEITASKCQTEDQTVPDPATMPAVRSLTAAELALYVCDLNPDSGRFPDQAADPGDVAAGNYSIVTLRQLFEFVDRYASSDRKSEEQRRNAESVLFNAETKRLPDRPETIGDGFNGADPGEFEQELALVIDDWGYQHRVIVQSFDHRSLWALQIIAPDVRLAALTLDEQPDLQTLSDAGAAIWSPHFTSLSIDNVAAAHSFDLDVIPWTVNDEGDVCALLDMGVDGVITDRPDLMLSEGGWLSGCQSNE